MPIRYTSEAQIKNDEERGNRRALCAIVFCGRYWIKRSRTMTESPLPSAMVSVRPSADTA